MMKDEYQMKPIEGSGITEPEVLTKLTHKEWSQRIADAMLKNLNDHTKDVPDTPKVETDE